MTTSKETLIKRTAIGFVAMLMLPLLVWTVTHSLKKAAKNESPVVVSSNPVGQDQLGLPFRYLWLSVKEPDKQLLMPVQNVRVRSVGNTWGAKRSGGRNHAGQDIFAKRGTPVYSATPGYVWHIGENGLGGKVVFVLGAGGRNYYYAHLDKHAEGLSEGAEVTTETVLGYVGTTGNAKRTPPHLHFGVYTMAGPINPLPMLADRG